MTQHKQSHRIKWHDQRIKWHDMTCPMNHNSSPHVTSQPSTVLHLTPQATSWHQNRSHHDHGTAEGLFTAKKWFGHRAGRSPCAHSIGKFFLWLVDFFLWNFRPRLVRALLVDFAKSRKYHGKKCHLTCFWHVLTFLLHEDAANHFCKEHFTQIWCAPVCLQHLATEEQVEQSSRLNWSALDTLITSLVRNTSMALSTQTSILVMRHSWIKPSMY